MSPRVDELQHFAAVLVGVAADYVLAEISSGGSDPHRPQTARSTYGDQVTSIDDSAERLIREQIAKYRPHDHVVGEEHGGELRNTPDVTWVVDPVAGTTNLTYGAPEYACSVAAVVNGIAVAGAIAEPRSGRIWTAGIGEGARVRDSSISRDWRPLRVSTTQELDRCLLATGFSYDSTERADQGAVLARLLPHINDIRRRGSTALDLCHVAAGWVDAYYEHGLHVWDWVAGTLIAEEAGAVCHWPGSPGAGARIGQPVFAAAPGIAAKLIEMLHNAGAANLHSGNPRLLRELPAAVHRTPTS